MVRNVFLLGHPGSGKSMVARLIEMFAKENGWSAYYINDYDLLQNMFLQEEKELIPPKERKFSPTGPPGCNGFDVKDFSVLDTVLRMMAKEVEAWEVENESEDENKSGTEDKLCLIEFARANYDDALQLFGSELLKDAHLLYVNVGIECCIERNHQRTDHFVSDEIMTTYYREDDWSRVIYALQRNWDNCLIRNSGTLQDLKQEVEEWVDIHLKREVQKPDSYVTVG